jgi:hypothetical protein
MKNCQKWKISVKGLTYKDTLLGIFFLLLHFFLLACAESFFLQGHCEVLLSYPALIGL